MFIFIFYYKISVYNYKVKTFKFDLNKKVREKCKVQNRRKKKNTRVNSSFMVHVKME